MTKFNVCVTAIIKNEAVYIEEWLCYHRALGVDHFFIFDNNSEDKIDDVLQPYINHGIVTLIRWPMLGGQIDAYNYSMHFFGRATEWMAYIDLDEFIALKDTASLPEFLSALTAADQLLIPWRSFGFSGHRKRPPGLVIENYTIAQDIPPEGFPRVNAKAIVRTSAAKRVTAHFAFTTSQATVDGLNKRVAEDFYLKNPNFDRIQVNHYYTKSYEEFEAKLARGQGDNGAEKAKIPFDRPGFATPDESALRNREATHHQMELMRSLSASPFRYGSQLAKGAPAPRDPFSWAAQVAISNYLAGTSTLRLDAPIAFENIAKGQNIMVARASDFDRKPSLGAFRRSIHITDVIRRLGNDVIFDLVADDDSRASEPGGVLAADVSANSSKHLLGGDVLKVATGRSAMSRCYCCGITIRNDAPLTLTLTLSSGESDAAVQKTINLPSAGHYCGIVEINREPIRATDLKVTLEPASESAEVFDLFAVAYG